MSARTGRLFANGSFADYGNITVMPYDARTISITFVLSSSFLASVAPGGSAANVRLDVLPQPAGGPAPATCPVPAALGAGVTGGGGGVGLRTAGGCSNTSMSLLVDVSALLPCYYAQTPVTGGA